MIEIWTEDSTAGYRFLKQVNKIIYKNQIMVVPHNGIGESTPAGIAKYGGILYHLKRHQRDHLVLLYIDKAIDMQETAENYENIIKEARNHVNVKIIEQICFELGMLSYNDLFNLCGNMKTEFMPVVREFVSLSKNLADFRPPNFSLKLRDYVMNKCGSKMQYEHVAKLMLAEATNVDTFYEGRHHYLSSISKGKIGSCWMKGCCVIPIQYEDARKCRVSPEILDNKIKNIVYNSFIQNNVMQIDDYIKEYTTQMYKAKESEDKKYETRYFEKFGNDSKLKHIGKILEASNYWNYERLYKNFKR